MYVEMTATIMVVCAGVCGVPGSERDREAELELE